MRIIVWNMHAPFEGPARHKLAWDYLRRQDFDVALLQETCDPDYDKAERKIEISATVSEAVANAFEKQKALPKEGSLVVLRDIAGMGFEPATFGL